MNSPLLDKSLDFATKIVLFYEVFSKTRKDTTIAKQLLRSATSVGANINETIYGNSKADFISKEEERVTVRWCSLFPFGGIRKGVQKTPRCGVFFFR